MRITGSHGYVWIDYEPDTFAARNRGINGSTMMRPPHVSAEWMTFVCSLNEENKVLTMETIGLMTRDDDEA